MLDSSFGTNGTVKTNFKSLPGLTEYTAIAVQPDGKVVAAGITDNNILALARYKPDGSLDSSFSEDGKVTVDSFVCTSITIQSDGKILVAGSSLIRFNTDGSVDNTFSGDGKITESFSISSIAIQPDNKIVVTGTVTNNYEGDFVAARYNTDGSPDNTFSGDGKVQTDIYRNDEAKQVIVQGDGKILVGGTSGFADKGDAYHHFTIVRYNSDGILDNTFNETGIVKYNDPDDNNIALRGIALQSDGKVLVLGTIDGNLVIVRFDSYGVFDNNFGVNGRAAVPLSSFIYPAIVEDNGRIIVASSKNGDFAIAGYNSDGSIDNSFGENGISLISISSQTDIATCLAVSKNKLYAGGVGAYFNSDIATVVCFTPGGTPDPSFGDGGIVNTYFGSGRGSTRYSRIAIQADKKVVTIGTTYNETNKSSFAVARYNTNGTLDNSFDGDGMQVTDFGSLEDIGTALAIQSDGKIVVVGYSTNEVPGSAIAIARYNQNGTLDSSFDGDGKQTTFVDPALYNRAYSVAIQNDGKIVVAGEISSNVTYILVVRYNTDGSLDNTFGQNGIQTTAAIELRGGASSVVIQKDGKIVVAGYAGPN
jgi:uncharacterized delta-60 repeat protein